MNLKIKRIDYPLENKTFYLQSSLGGLTRMIDVEFDADEEVHNSAKESLIKAYTRNTIKYKMRRAKQKLGHWLINNN